jgi:HEAT repeat protein
VTPRRVITGLLILAGGVSATLIYLSIQREPAYAGKTLSQWVQQLKSPDAAQRRAAVTVLRQLGSAPVPQLRRMLRARDTTLKRFAERWSAKVPFLKLRFVPACEQHKIAAEIVSWTGHPEVVPDLSALLDARNCSCAHKSAEALSRLMPAATPALLKALTNKDGGARWVAAANLAENPSDQVISNLAGALRDPSSGVRMVAAVSLGEMQRRPDLVVPALRDALDTSPQSSTRAAVARALGRFGVNAKTAIPQLQLLSSHTNDTVATAAAEALRRIGAAGD